MPPKRKRGRPAQYVVGRDGQPIIGLSFSKTRGIYYATHQRDPKVYFGTDFDQALLAFRNWQAGQNGRDTISLPEMRPLITEEGGLQDDSVAEGWISREDASKSVPWPVNVPGDAFYARFRELILDNPQLVAERTGIAEIGYLQKLTPPAESLTLRQVADLYFNKRKKLTAHWKRKQSLYWREFVKIVGAATVRDIAIDDIQRYHDTIWNQYEKNDLSTTWLSQRFECVSTVFRYALKSGKDQQEVRRVIDLTAVFEKPRKNGADPHPISPEAFRELVAVSSVKWRAVLLLSLNAALYPAEVADVKVSHVDLGSKTMTMTRNKTGIVRIATLWNRTVGAIHEYRDTEKHQSPYLFVSVNGDKYTANHVGRNFRRRRAEAKLPDSVTFDAIRDGAITAACKVSADAAKWIAGHRVPGKTDEYLKRHPELAADACAAIERAYFG
jgi:integrase